jgi:hypothetical protein
MSYYNETFAVLVELHSSKELISTINIFGKLQVVGYLLNYLEE